MSKDKRSESHQHHNDIFGGPTDKHFFRDPCKVCGRYISNCGFAYTKHDEMHVRKGETKENYWEIHGPRITINVAAIKKKDGSVHTGRSHASIIQAQSKGFFKSTEDIKTTIQGFVTSEGKFVNRKKAGKIAYEAGQIKRLTTMLFSEDITGDWGWKKNGT